MAFFLFRRTEAFRNGATSMREMKFGSEKKAKKKRVVIYCIGHAFCVLGGLLPSFTGFYGFLIAWVYPVLPDRYEFGGKFIAFLFSGRFDLPLPISSPIRFATN